MTNLEGIRFIKKDDRENEDEKMRRDFYDFSKECYFIPNKLKITLNDFKIFRLIQISCIACIFYNVRFIIPLKNISLRSTK